MKQNDSNSVLSTQAPKEGFPSADKRQFSKEDANDYGNSFSPADPLKVKGFRSEVMYIQDKNPTSDSESVDLDNEEL